MINNNLDYKEASKQVEEIVENALKKLGKDSFEIKQQKYEQIKKELKELEQYFVISDQVFKSSGRYSSQFGFQSEQAYFFQVEKDLAKYQIIVYQKLNKILDILRNTTTNHILYIKDEENEYVRYEISDEELLYKAQATGLSKFSSVETARNEYKIAVEDIMKTYKKSQEQLSNHIKKYLTVLKRVCDNENIQLSQPDQYEAFEYHYQTIDQKSKKYDHGFTEQTEKGIAKWLHLRGHDTVPWYVRGDIGNTSVKSADLSKKLIVQITSVSTLNRVYTNLYNNLSSNELNAQQIADLIKAFTPVVTDSKSLTKSKITQIVNNFINELTI